MPSGTVRLVSLTQPLKISPPFQMLTVVQFSGMLMDESFVQSANARYPIVVTLSGRTMLSNAVQPSKAYRPMTVKAFGSVTVVRLTQPENACSPSVVIAPEQRTVWRVLLSLNAFSPIAVTGYPPSFSGRMIAVSLPVYFVMVAFSEEMV